MRKPPETLELSKLIQRCQAAAKITNQTPELNPEVTRLSDDSRTADEQTIFLLTPQGASYLSGALLKGVAAVLVESSAVEQVRAEVTATGNTALLVADELLEAQGELSAALYNFPSRELKVVGVTGTNGKTSIADILYHLWRESGIRAGVIGTLGVRWQSSRGDEQRCETGYTTPRSYQLQEILRKMADDGVTHVALEVSSEGIAYGRIEGCIFSAAVFTNLTPEHLDFHGDMESYYIEKEKLFIRTAAQGGRLIVGRFDEYGERLYNYCKNKLNAALESLSEIPELDVTPPLNFQRINAGLALLAAFTAESDRAAARDALAKLPEIPGRFNLVYSSDPELYGVVDYAHSPAALENLLLEVRNLTPGFVVTLFGCGGQRDPDKRAAMGGLAMHLSDLVVVTDDNPRGEDPAAIRAAIIQGAESARSELEQNGGRQVEILEIGNRRAAIEQAVRRARESKERPAIVVVAGKGHEEYQIIQGQRRPFSDRAELKRALEADERVEV